MNILMGFLTVYLMGTSSYLLFCAIASYFYKQRNYKATGSENSILVLLPVYKEDQVILESAKKALALNYNQSKFDVAVIADSLQSETITKLEDQGCIVVKMDLMPRSKAKAINLALKSIPEVYDICVVLDADNCLSDDALVQINSAYNAGAKAIQCQRVAKEITTPVSVLDAVSEGINNTIFRKGHRAMGLSAALAGSGMAFDYFFFSKVMARIQATNGFDKDLEFEVISSGVTIEYLESVPVYDEKVSSLDVLQKQRTRWFAAQIINIRKGFYFFIRKPSLDLLDKWWQMFIPSRLLLFGFMAGVTALSIAFQQNVFTKLFIVATLSTGLALLLAAPRKYFKGKIWLVVIHLPLSFVTLVLSLLSINKARRGFIHTPHTPKV